MGIVMAGLVRACPGHDALPALYTDPQTMRGGGWVAT
jgi:hypothetical protein